MDAPVEVTDPADPRLVDYVGLTDVVRRWRAEPEFGLFVAEGELVILRALAAGYPVRSVLCTPRWLPPLAPAIADQSGPVYLASEDVLLAVTGFHVHRGALASFGRLPLPAPAELLASATRVVVLENVNNPTNVGAVFRGAAALGMDAVLLDPRCADPLYRRSVRVSMGGVFAVPYARLAGWPGGLGDTRSAGFRLLALTPGPEGTPLDRLQLGPDERAALLFGAEGPGLSDDALSAADDVVTIPMARGVDSLNVGAAAAIACWVLGRRDEPGIGGPR